MKMRLVKPESIFDKYVEHFNKRRNAGIKDILPFVLNGEWRFVIRYLEGRDIPLKNAKTFVQLFDVLDKLHPSIKKVS